MNLRFRSRHMFALPAVSVALVLAIAASESACGGKVDPTITSVPLPIPEPSAPPRDSGTPLTPDARVPVTRPPLPPQTQATEVDLGVVENGATVTLAVPPNALGFNVVVKGDIEDVVGVARIKSPSGELVHNEHIVVGGKFETSLSDEIAAASVPQNKLASTMPVEPGAWSITVSSRAAKPVRVSARIQISGDGAFHGGASDMHVYIPRGLRIEDPDRSHVVTAAGAATDRSVEARIDSFYRALEATTGILRGTVTFHDVDASLVRISTERALDSAFAVSKGIVPDGEQSIHVVFTNDLDFGDGVWGIASGIPGAATRTGTRASGVALAVTGDTPADMDGLALLHEVGHFVGLNHTTEFVGGFSDPLADTPSCAGILDPARPQTLDRCPDNDNLMFPTLWSARILLSDSQKVVYRGSPTYKAFIGPNTLPVEDAGAADAGSRDASTDGPSFASGDPGSGPSDFLEAVDGVSRPGTVARFTKSGRALTPSERFVLGGLCGGSPLDLRRMQGHLGPTLARAELTRIAADPDLLGVIRMRAGKLLLRATR